jgi:hypothetical protein
MYDVQPRPIHVGRGAVDLRRMYARVVPAVVQSDGLHRLWQRNGPGRTGCDHL